MATLRQEVVARVDDVASVLASAAESPANRLEGLKYYYPGALSLDGSGPGSDGGGIVTPDEVSARRFPQHFSRIRGVNLNHHLMYARARCPARTLPHPG